MEKDFYYIELFEVYKGLLTEKQREMFYSHFCLDLSLSEIAEGENTSRQSVYDAIKKVKCKLDEYEKELKLKHILTEINQLSNSVSDGELAQKLKDIIGR